ncbi:MAG: DUF1501 domain-containing protein [Planctomycetota bacterium]
MNSHSPYQHLNRRSFFSNIATTAGSIALAQMFARDGLLVAETPLRPAIDPTRPFAARKPHFPAKAEQVLIIFCAGAVSHIDTWDYKPELYQHHGKTPPNAPKVTFQGPIGNLAKPFWDFKPRGQCGKMISNLVPHLAELADDMCFIHSLTSKNSAHTQAENFLSTGFTFEGYPSLGSWATYALGTANENLPSFVAIADPRGRPQAGPNNWGSGFLPAAFQGTAFSADQPPQNLRTTSSVQESANRATVDLLSQLNDEHLTRYPGDTDLTARISSYELAGRMQTSIPGLMDLSQENKKTLETYGADSPNTIKAEYARNCILARRLLEQGVRVVQLFNGAYASGGRLNWDSHADIVNSHGAHAEILDQPTAALLRDLKQRGQLDKTLVVWCTEFGRMPFMQANGTGRDHNIEGFTCWLMGAGVKPGVSYGSTDELGWKATENVTTLYDFNATILHLLGLDHERLSYYFNGTNRRLTDVHGHVIKELLA